MDTMSPSHHLSRDDLRDIAVSTLQALDEGEYFPPGAVDPYDLRTKIEWTDDNTRYYGPDAGEDGEILESEFIRINEEGGNEGKDEKEEEGDKMSVGEQDKNASSLDGTKQGEDGSDNVATAASEAENKQVDDNSNPKAQAQAEVPIPPNPTADSIICIGEYSTLFGARRVHFALAPDPSPNKKIGVLNFASAKKPGGGFINGSQAQEESIARTSTLYPSLITPAALPFYTHHREDPSNAYYTHAMVYSPGVVLLRDDNGEWRSPVKVDVLTSAAVNAGEIRRGLEKEERLRKEREELEIWRRRGEERRKEREKAMAEKEKIMAEKESLRKEKEIFKREQEKLKKEQEKFKKEKAEAAKLKKEKAGSTKLRKGTAKSGDGNGTEKAKETYSGSEKEETSSEDQKEKEREIEQEKENENEKAESEKAESEKAESEKAENENEEKEKKKEKETATDTPEETATDTPEEKVTDTPEETATDNPEEKATVNPESGSGPDGEVKTAEENTESKGASIQDVQPQSEATPEVSKEPTSSTTILHPLSQTQLSQAPKPDPEISYIHRLENAEYQIQHTMYTRISRILHLFQLHQTPYLILGSFGTGVFQNNTDIVANIFAELLVKPGGRFKNVFKTVVFAILGKETVRVFEKVFSKVEKLGKRTRGGSCVLMDEDGSDRDVKEGSEERMMRMMRWEGRRTALAEAAQAEADAASFAAIQADIAQAEIEAASWAAIQAEIDAAAAVDADPTAPDDDRIAEDEKMILTEDGEVDFAVRETVNATTTPKVMITEDGKDAEMEEIKSLSASNCEAKLNQKGDDDVEMQ
ncbi:hypothetical protein BYT27DRAFT_6840744 [Phlegmacium glaucopus]|nr:hypothetical protein BYT27DRAFT_6840744 [Phlegmacium glaucopus]